jgi:hypothetical protein
MWIYVRRDEGSLADADVIGQRLASERGTSYRRTPDDEQ